MAEGSYEPGSLSDLIATKSSKDRQKTSTLASKEKLQQIFNDPSSSEYAMKPVPIEPEVEPESNHIEQRRKEVREKSKLVKLRQQEKVETGNHTVFVGNVPLEAQKKDIMKFFQKYGTIKSIRFRSLMRKDITKPLKASAIKKDIHPLCKSVNVYIVYEEEKSAIRALKRNGKELMGAHLRVDLASSAVEREPNRKCSIFIGNVPFDAHEEAMWKHFTQCGDISNVRLIKDKETRLGKGFGYVEFKSPDGVALALQMDGQKFGKNKLRVQRCLRQDKAAGSSNKNKSWSGSFADKQRKPKLKGQKAFARKPSKKPTQNGKRGNKPSKVGLDKKKKRWQKEKA